MRSDVIERLRARMVEDPRRGCWLWQGALNKEDGYAVAQTGGRREVVHRVLYEEFFGPIPEGLESHHVCLSKQCCNPAHIMLVTKAEHLQLDRYNNILMQRRGHRQPKKPYDSELARERYRQNRAAMSPDQLAAYNAHVNARVQARRKADPEKIRAQERAKYARRIARDRQGFLATRKAQALRRRQNKNGVQVELTFSECTWAGAKCFLSRSTSVVRLRN